MLLQLGSFEILDHIWTRIRGTLVVHNVRMSRKTVRHWGISHRGRRRTHRGRCHGTKGGMSRKKKWPVEPVVLVAAPPSQSHCCVSVYLFYFSSQLFTLSTYILIVSIFKNCFPFYPTARMNKSWEAALSSTTGYNDENFCICSQW